MLFIAAALWPLSAKGEDVVVLSAKRDRTTRMVGEIVDLSGAQLVFRHSSGRQETVDGNRVLEVESVWGASHRAGDAYFQSRDYTEALSAYGKAFAGETRRWAKRRILARIVWCNRYLDRVDRAGEAFQVLYRSDPTTRDFAAIPLVWATIQTSPTIEARAKEWLADKDSAVARLMGASWLLSTSARGEAMRVLQRLVSDRDARVVYLGEAQAWRTHLATVDDDETARWSARVEQMPASIRAGPSFVLAQALARNGESQSAALAYLRIPILYSAQHQLSARSLLAAGRELARMGQVAQARGLYREVILRYPTEQAAGEARREFEGLK